MTKQYRVLVEGYREDAHLGKVGNGVCFEQWYDSIEDAYDRYCSYACDLHDFYCREWINRPTGGRDTLRRGGYQKMLECWEDNECVEDLEYDTYGYEQYQREHSYAVPDAIEPGFVRVGEGEIANFNNLSLWMDEDIRERVERLNAGCTEQAFYDTYCVMHKHCLGKPFIYETR